MKTSARKKSGFTLVELLVVIAILAVVASLGMVVGLKAVKKGKLALMVNNMKQMTPFFSAYAADNGGDLLPCRAEHLQANDTYAEMLWFQYILMQLYPDTDTLEFNDKDWWKNNRCILQNPLFADYTPDNPGYAYNIMLPTNYYLGLDGSSPGQIELEATAVPTSIIDQPANTPLIAPCNNYFYRYDAAEIGGFENSVLNEFLVDQKIPVLFVDGHVSMYRPKEYVDKELHLMPGQTTTNP